MFGYSIKEVLEDNDQYYDINYIHSVNINIVTLRYLYRY